MKSPFSYSILLLVILLFYAPKTHANSAGGELIYVHISDSTYQFFFKYYRDCSGSSEPDSLPLCFYNSCTNTTFSVNMNKWMGTLPPGLGPIIAPPCTSIKTNCDSIGSPVSAYRVWWYSAIATLPLRCNSWRIFTYGPARNNINNFQNPTTSSLYVEVTFDNTISHANSSPYYAITPMYAVPQNQNYSYNNGALDADGDSLWTDVILPRTGVSTCNDTAVNMVFSTASPSYTTVNNPFQTTNTFNLNGANGLIFFTSTAIGKSNVVFRTREFRNGVQIGSVMREMQVQTVSNIPAPPTYSTGSSCSVSTFYYKGNYYIPGCVGSQMSFCFDVISNDTNSRIFLSDNLISSIPGASLYYSNQGTDSVHAVFSWVPSIYDIGQRASLVLITDSICNGTGVVFQYARQLDYYVWGRTKAGNDTTICPGNPATLSVSGGDNYHWTVLSGSQNSLSNPNVPYPIATPTTTTTYVVTSTINPYCTTLNKDTVTINMRPPSPGAAAVTNTFSCGLTNPGLNYIYKCVGDTISFCMNSRSANTSAWLYHSDNLPTSAPSATISYTNQGTDSAIATFSWVPGINDGGLHTILINTTDSACVPNNTQRTKVQPVYLYIWPPTQTIEDTFICPGQSIQLPVWGGNSFSWNILPGGTPNSLSNVNSSQPIATPTVTTTYAVMSNSTTCNNNNTDTVTIIIPANISTPGPATITVMPDSTITPNTSVTFTATSTGCNNPQYTWVVDGNVANVPDQNTFTTSNMTHGQQVWCYISCKDSCATPSYTNSNRITMKVYTTDISDVTTNNNINLYPNPNNGDFNIKSVYT
ncbi:MAG: hypothetical protein KDC07_03455, partial [Chitinophagaceae bacterium]|nr:hypothetical protein [Chitinophagaceae bacterium]